MNEGIIQDVKDQLAGALDYDKAAKGVLSQKKVLAYILKRTVPEFESASLDDIANIYIEGKPEVSTVPVSKDKTNAVRHALERQDTPKIKGTQNEDNSITEGSIVFVYLGNSKVKDQLINLLDLMFKSSKNASEKITALHNDFGIDLTKEGEEDLEIMCNLGEGLYEDGVMKGKQEGKIESALEMLKDGVALEKVAKYSKLSLSMIEKLAKQNKLI